MTHPIYQRQKCSPATLLSCRQYKVHVDIAEVRWRGTNDKISGQDSRRRHTDTRIANRLARLCITLIYACNHHRNQKLKTIKSSSCSSAAYTSQARVQQRFTISEVTADWHELMISQRTMRPSIARVSEQLDPRYAASRHTTAPTSHAA